MATPAVTVSLAKGGNGSKSDIRICVINTGCLRALHGRRGFWVLLRGRSIAEGCPRVDCAFVGTPGFRGVSVPVAAAQHEPRRQRAAATPARARQRLGELTS